MAALLIVGIFAASANGEDVVLVGAEGFRVHHTALEGFRSVFTGSIKRLSPEDAFLVESIRRVKPRLVVALGHDALQAVEGIRDMPVVFFMVLNPRGIAAGGTRVTGVDMVLPVEKQLDEIKEVMPWARRVGVIYDPDETAHLVKRARSAAPSRGLEIVERRVGDTREVFGAVESLRGEIDLLWMLPDLTVLDYETVKYMMAFSYESKTPIYAISEKYVTNSALMASGIDVFDIGMQAGEMANRILSGEEAGDIPVEHPRKGKLFINLRTARKLELDVPAEALEKATRVYGEDR